MTTARDIITDALRESGILALGETPSADSLAEGLTRLNVLVKGTFGYDFGEPLTVLNIGEEGIDTPEGLATVASEGNSTSPIPVNSLLHANLTSGATVYLEPAPYDGARLSVVDLSGNFSTNPLVLDGNGKKINGASSVTLSTDSTNVSYFYRADKGEWVLFAPLTASDEFPFPTEFDDYFVTSLALRLNPRYGAETTQETLTALTRTRSMFRARYNQIIEKASELALQRISPWRVWDLSTTSFNRGRPWNY